MNPPSMVKGQASRRARVCLSPYALASLFLVATMSSPLLAQGCAMCKASIAGQTVTLARSLNLGIVVLLIPPLLIMSVILYLAFRYD